MSTNTKKSAFQRKLFSKNLRNRAKHHPAALDFSAARNLNLAILVLFSLLLTSATTTHPCFGDNLKWPRMVGTETRTGDIELLSIDKVSDSVMIVGGAGTETTFEATGASTYGFIGRIDTSSKSWAFRKNIADAKFAHVTSISAGTTHFAAGGGMGNSNGVVAIFNAATGELAGATPRAYYWDALSCQVPKEGIVLNGNQFIYGTCQATNFPATIGSDNSNFIIFKIDTNQAAVADAMIWQKTFSGTETGQNSAVVDNAGVIMFAGAMMNGSTRQLWLYMVDASLGTQLSTIGLSFDIDSNGSNQSITNIAFDVDYYYLSTQCTVNERTNIIRVKQRNNAQIDDFAVVGVRIGANNILSVLTLDVLSGDISKAFAVIFAASTNGGNNEVYNVEIVFGNSNGANFSGTKAFSNLGSMNTVIYDAVFAADFSSGYLVGSSQGFDGPVNDYAGNGVAIGFIEQFGWSSSYNCMDLDTTSLPSDNNYIIDTQISNDNTFQYTASFTDSSHTLTELLAYPVDAVVTDPVDVGVFCSTTTYTIVPGTMAAQTYTVNGAAISAALSTQNDDVTDCSDDVWSYSFIQPAPIDTAETAHLVNWDAVNSQLIIQSSSCATVGTHTITAVGTMQNDQSASFTFSLTVIGDSSCTGCQSSRTISGAISDTTYTLHDAQATIAYPYSSDDATCTMTVTYYTKVQGADDSTYVENGLSDVITNDSTNSQFLLLYNTANDYTSHVGAYEVGVKITTDDGSSTESFDNFILTIASPCSAETLTASAITVAYDVGATADVQTLSQSDISTSSLTDVANCGGVTFTCSGAKCTETPPFTFATPTTTATLTTSTSDVADAGTHTMDIIATYTNFPSVSVTIGVTVTITDPCASVTITAPGLTAQTYTQEATQVDYTFTAFTLSSSSCGTETYTYSAVDSGGSAADLSSVVTLTSATRTFNFYLATMDASLHDTYTITVTATLGAVTQTDTFDLTIIHPCKIATISFTTQFDSWFSTQSVYQTSSSYDFTTANGFTSTQTEAKCGNFVYDIVKSDNNALDSTLFTYTAGATNTLAVQTDDASHVGTHDIKVRVYHTGYQTETLQELAKTLTVDNPCATATVADLTLVDQVYTMGTAAATYQHAEIPASTAFCPVTYTYSAVMATPSVGSPGSLSTVITGYVSGTRTFTYEVATVNSALYGTYTVTVTSTCTASSNTGEGTYTLTVHIPCDHADVMSINSVYFADWTLNYNLFAAAIQKTWTDADAVTSTRTTADCGAFQYTITMSDNSTPPTDLFTIDTSAKTLDIESSNLAHATTGTFNLKFSVQHTANGGSTQTLAFTVTVANPCEDASIITITSSHFTGWTFTQSVYQPVTQKTWTNSDAQTSTQTEANCGAFIWTIVMSADDSTPPTDLFTIDTTAQTMDVQTDNPDHATTSTFNLKFTVQHTGYDITKKEIAFTVTVDNPCASATVTAADLTAVTETYTMKDTAATYDPTDFTPSPSSCPITYEATVSPVAGMGAISSFDSTTGIFTWHTATVDSSLAATYTITLTGTIGAATDSTTFTYTVVDPCTTATITAATMSSWTFTYLVHDPAHTVSYTTGAGNDISTATYDETDCGAYLIELKMQDDSTVPSMFTFDSSAKTLSVVSTSISDVGAYNLQLEIKHTGYDSTLIEKDFVVTVNDPCDSNSLITINAVTFATFGGTYNLNTATITKTWTTSNWGSSTETEAKCGNLIGAIERVDGATLDSIFNVGYDSENNEHYLKIWSGNVALAGNTYNLLFSLQHDGYPSTKVVVNFDYTIANSCSSATLSGTSDLVDSVGAPATTMQYTIGYDAVSYFFTGFTISDSSCSPVTYSVSLTEVTGSLTGLAPNDELFDFTKLDDGRVQLDIHYTDSLTDYVGTYDVQIIGTFQSQTQSFTVGFEGICTAGTLSASSFSAMELTMAEAAVTQSFSDFSTELSCGYTYTYALQQADGSAPPDGVSLSSQTITVDCPTLSSCTEGSYDMQIVGTIDDQASSSVTSSTFTITIIAPVVEEEQFVISMNTPPTLSPVPTNQQVELLEIREITLGAIIDNDEVVNVECVVKPSSDYIETFCDDPDSLSVTVTSPATEQDLGTYCIEIYLTDTNEDPMSAEYQFKIDIVTPTVEEEETTEEETTEEESTSEEETTEEETTEGEETSEELDLGLDVSGGGGGAVSQQDAASAAAAAAKYGISMEELLALGWTPDNPVWEIPPSPVMSVKSFTNIGVMTLKFSEEMIVPKNLTSIDSSILEIKILPGSDQEMDNLNFTWEVIDFDGKEMNIQFYFETALYVSTGTTVDRVRVQVVDTETLKTLKNRQFEKGDNIVLKSSPKQLQLGAAAEALDSAGAALESSSQTVVVVNLVINVILSGSLTLLWGMVNALQIIVHLPLIAVATPANAQMVLSTIMGISNFDVLPAGDIMDATLNFHPTYPVNSYYEENGYETSNFAECLGTFYLIILFVMFKLLILLIIHPFTYFFYPLKFSMWLRKGMFWGELIRICLEGYLETTISALINYDWMYWENWSDMLVNSNVIMFTVLNFIAPIFLYIFLNCNMFRVENHAFEKVYGAFWEGLNTNNTYGGMYYNVFFCVRRLLLGMLLALCTKIVIMQVQVAVVLCLSAVMYNGLTRPFDTLFHNKIEMFNEINILLCAYFLFLYTDFTEGPEQQFSIGWAHILVIGNVVIVNLSFLIYSAVADAILKCKKSFRKKKYENALKKMQANKYAPASNISLSITSRSSVLSKASDSKPKNNKTVAKTKTKVFKKKMNKLKGLQDNYSNKNINSNLKQDLNIIEELPSQEGSARENVAPVQQNNVPDQLEDFELSQNAEKAMDQRRKQIYRELGIKTQLTNVGGSFSSKVQMDLSDNSPSLYQSSIYPSSAQPSPDKIEPRMDYNRNPDDEESVEMDDYIPLQ